MEDQDTQKLEGWVRAKIRNAGAWKELTENVSKLINSEAVSAGSTVAQAILVLRPHLNDMFDYLLSDIKDQDEKNKTESKK